MAKMAESLGIFYVGCYSLNSDLFIFTVVSALLALSGCASVKAQQNAVKPHHTPDGFKNNYAPNAASSSLMKPAITWVGHATMLVQANGLKAKRSVGVHWGTFNLTDEPLDQPPKDLAAALLEQGLAPDVFTVMAIGETRLLPSRTAP